MLKRLGERFAAAKAADPVEVEQGRIRLYVLAAVSVYLMTFLWGGGIRVLDESERINFLSFVCIILVSVAHFGWILLCPGVNHRRRRLAVWLDMGGITWGLVRTNEIGVMLYGLYHWVVIGNGFRYGRWYLHYAQAAALAGFAAVAVFSPYWHRHFEMDAAFFVMLVAIPWYVSQLLARLQAARAQAEAANAAKTKFLAAASHDLRQPMQALSMYVSVLEARVGDADALRVVHGVQVAVRTLEQLFDGVLDISKIESGVVKANVVVFPLMPLIDRVIEAENPIAALKKLTLRAVRTSACVRSDPMLLERMLKNLVTNAIRYTDRGGIVVGCRRVGGNRLRLEVVDTGVGIPLQEQERIFHEYYQLEGASAQGLGLGLPIVQSLGKLLGHGVTVRSAVGRGSVFAVELERAPGVALSAPVDSVSLPRDALSGIAVVLVDDDSEIRHSMRFLLESWGCRYIGGATLAEVEEKLRTQRTVPDAVVVDYRLAEAMTGLQVIERLRAAYGKGLPALVITGTPRGLPVQQSAAGGGVPVALKPVSPGALRAFLSRSVRRRGAERV